LRLHK